MADQTIAANKLMESVVLEGFKDEVDRYTEIFQINGTDMIGGLIVTTFGESNDDIDLAASGEIVTGILVDYAFPAEKKASFSLGVTIADDKKARVLTKTGGRVVVQCLLDQTTTTAKTASKGAPVFLSQTVAGLVSLVSPGTGSLVLQTHVGYLEDELASFTANKVIRVRF